MGYVILFPSTRRTSASHCDTTVSQRAATHTTMLEWRPYCSRSMMDTIETAGVNNGHEGILARPAGTRSACDCNVLPDYHATRDIQSSARTRPMCTQNTFTLSAPLDPY